MALFTLKLLWKPCMHARACTGNNRVFDDSNLHFQPTVLTYNASHVLANRNA